MLSNLTHGNRVTVTAHCRQFDYVGETDWGFGFPCDEHGNVDAQNLLDPARANYEACIDGRVAVVDRGVQTRTHSYWNPGHGTCACGRRVTLDGDQTGYGIDCACGRIYNGSGQELRPRDQWEENDCDDY